MTDTTSSLTYKLFFYQLIYYLRANPRRLVKRVLRKYGYPPDKQEQAIVTVLQQAELLAGGWVG